jgi:hypothetical protein
MPVLRKKLQCNPKMKQWLFKPKAQQQAVERPMPSLVLCILMDLLGMASFGVPILGELLDIVWAPIAAVIYYRMFGKKMGLFGGAFTFLEELLPGTDIIPTFTISWFLQYARRKQKVSYYPVR